jgi:hypothetical protein
MTERAMVRLTLDDVADFDAECERLTTKTGQRWTISSYLRLAGRLMKGQHLP